MPFVSSLKRFKPLLITLGSVILLLILLPLAGIWAMESYVKQAVYPDLKLVIYEEAQDAIAKTSWSWIGLPLLTLDDTLLRPNFFLRQDDFTYEAQQRVFDYTKQPATFAVTGLSQNPGKIKLAMLVPTEFNRLGFTFDSQVSCSLNYTLAQEQLIDASATLKLITAKDGSIDTAKLQDKNIVKTYDVWGEKSVFDFLKTLLTRQDIVSGQKQVRLQTTCDTETCGFVGPECAITIMPKQ